MIREMHRTSKPRRGILLLVVLSMLAFLSILVVTYVAFASRSRQSAFALARREYRAPQPSRFLDDALMTLVRGTADQTNRLYGEDLLSDLYGRKGALTGCLPYPFAPPPIGPMPADRRPAVVGGPGSLFVRIPLFAMDGPEPSTSSPVYTIAQRALREDDANPLTTNKLVSSTHSARLLDDGLTGRTLTFQTGPLANRPFRILRSIGGRVTSNPLEAPEFVIRDSVFIELDADLIVTLANGASVRIGDLVNYSAPAQMYSVGVLFYNQGGDNAWGTGSPNYWDVAMTGSDDQPFDFRISPVPLNGAGVGYTNSGMNVTQQDTIRVSSSTQLPLPVSFVGLTATTGGFIAYSQQSISGDWDETYDAADLQNWYLSHRYTDENGITRVIPSFHRPALINYLVNQYDLSSVSAEELMALVTAIRRSTLRPLPFSPLQLAGRNDLVPGSPSHPTFTGGNRSYALRSPNLISNPASIPQMARLEQLVDSLVNGPWDVDNDGDGIEDSVWLDLGLPTVTSPEGKLLRPLIAPMIEDLSGRLNINAHGSMTHLATLLSSNASGPSPYSDDPSGPWAGNVTDIAQEVLRGLGYGPSEIVLPSNATPLGIDPSGQALTAADAINLVLNRYQHGRRTEPAWPAPGVNTADSLDLLMTGTRPGTHGLNVGYGMSLDPWGRGGIGIHRSGRLYAAVSGTVFKPLNSSLTPPQRLLNESVNDPYEFDPTGRLAGDVPYTFEDLEFLLTGSDWDSDLLPARLRQILAGSNTVNPKLAQLLTTRSASLDVPPAVLPEGSRSIPTFPVPPSNFTTLFDVLKKRLNITDANASTDPAAVRKKFDDLIAQELRLGLKLDVNRPFGNGADDNSNDVIDEPLEFLTATPAETNKAFPTAAAAGLNKFTGPNANPDYNFEYGNTATDPTGRDLLARHLYVLAMAFTGLGYEFPVVDDSVIAPGSPESDAYRAHRLAQWAVNVVDFRDPDSIMTRFVYDPEPFDIAGWDPPTPPTLPGPGPGNVVWGVESPELLFSESVALHDVRVRDTKNEVPGGSGKNKSDTPADEHTDSIRMPQGSLFLELYCPRSRPNSDVEHQSAVPQELYALNATSGHFELDLDRNAPAAGAGQPAVPVWRIAISEPHYEGSGQETWDPELLRAELPDTTSFEPTAPDELGIDPPSSSGSPPPLLEMDRFIFFQQYPDYAAATNVANAIADVDPDEMFFSYNNADRDLLPSQYLMLVPRLNTALGSQRYSTDPVGPSPQRLEVVTGAPITGLRHTDWTGAATTLNTTAQTQPALAMKMGTFPPTTWSNARAFSTVAVDNMVGMNVSEPMPQSTAGYYPEPTVSLKSSDTTNFPLEDAYLDFDDTGGTQAFDIPVDVNGAMGDLPIGDLTRVKSGDPTTDPKEPYLGTVPRYRTAFLQRLADPTLPYDADTNPYRTVDWISIDLTVFSGEETESNVAPTVSEPYALTTRQRNGESMTGTPMNLLYSYQTDFDDPTGTLSTSGPYFALEDPAAAAGPAPLLLDNSLNHLNVDFFGAPITGIDRGQPSTPFAMHEWLNRPFASVYELMLVPATSQGRLFEEFSTASTTEVPYLPVPYTTPTNEAEQFQAPFRHLLNFFQSSLADDEAAHLYRLFDFVGTRPPFRGERELVNPDRLTPTAGPPANAADFANNFFVSAFRPPFNVFWNGRREGQINLNAIGEYPVWMGLMHGHLTATERALAFDDKTAGDLTYQGFLTSRRGYAVSKTAPPEPIISGGTVNAPPYNFSPATLDHRFPTEFGGVFRTGLDSDLAPKAPSPHTNNPHPLADDLLRRPGIDGGLARRDTAVTSAAPEDNPLFVRPGTGSAYADRDRHSFMRYQTLMRMPNLASHQSQIFLVRLTLGYFEVDAAAVGSLGREYNSDIGRNQRYKATFIIDRSVPVDFVPGADTNVRDTVLFSRMDD